MQMLTLYPHLSLTRGYLQLATVEMFKYYFMYLQGGTCFSMVPGVWERYLVLRTPYSTDSFSS